MRCRLRAKRVALGRLEMPVIEQNNHKIEAEVGSITQTINLGSYSNSLLLVFISMNNDSYETVDSVTWNGTPLIDKGGIAQDDDAQVDAFYLVNPEAGNYNLVANFSDTLQRNACVGYVVLSGVDQVTPLGNLATVAEEGGAGSPVTISVESAVNDLVFAVLATEDESSVTEGTGQTPLYEVYQNVGGRELCAAASYKAGAATSTNMEYALSDDDHRAMAGVAVKPAAAGGGQPMSLRGKQVPFLRSW